MNPFWTMRRATDVMPMRDWLLMYPVVLALLVTLRASWGEICIFMALDTISLPFALVGVSWWIEQWIAPSTWPSLEQLESGANELGNEQRVQMLEALFRVPARLTLMMLVISQLKVLPAVSYLSFGMHAEFPRIQQCAIVLAYCCWLHGIFYGFIFAHTHARLGEVLDRLQRQPQWDEAFRTVRLDEMAHRLEINSDLVSFLGVWCPTLCTQILLARSGLPTDRVVALLLGTTTLGVFISVRLWSRGRGALTAALNAICDRLNRIDGAMSGLREPLPMHSMLLLARFEQAFNRLLDRLGKHEQELSLWVVARTEDQRYQAVSELAALIVHDLSSPLQSLRLDAELLLTPATMDSTQRGAAERIQEHSTRALELVQSLRSYLRPGGAEPGSSDFAEALVYVRRLMRTRFGTQWVDRVRWDVDGRVDALNISLSRSDLIHILMNLVANGLENQVGNAVAMPFIAVELVELESQRVALRVRDGGTGLSPQAFEELTGLDYLIPSALVGQRSLGLRLVRRLIERRGGSLVVEASSGPGTSFLLRLPGGW